jgi:integrase
MKGTKRLRDQRANKTDRLRAGHQRWQFVVSTGKLNPNGRHDRRYKTFVGTEAQADAALREFISEIERGLQLESRLTVAQYADRWLEEKERENAAGKTLIRYESIIRCYIKPTMGQLVLAELSAAHVKQALHQWRSAPRKDSRKNGAAPSESTLHHVFSVLFNLCDIAVDDRKMKENPCRFLRRSQRPRKSTPTIAAAEAKAALALLDALGDTIVGPIVELACYTGLRAGEALGLPWGKVDLDAGVLFVEQVCELRSDRDGKRLAHIRPYPKTRSSIRDVPLPPQTITLLRRLKAEYNARLLSAGLTASSDHLVFANANLGSRAGLPWDPTTPWSPDEFSSAYHWRVSRTGLPYMCFKALGRATYSTLMADAGIPIQVVQRLLGHSSMTTTMKHYVRILDHAKAQAAQLFGESLEAVRRRRPS